MLSVSQEYDILYPLTKKKDYRLYSSLWAHTSTWRDSEKVV